MERLLTGAHGVARVSCIMGGLLLLAAALLISFDIVTRKLFSWSVGGADELSGYAMAIAGAWGFSITLLSRSHIRIDTVYLNLRPRWRAPLDIVALAAFLLFMGLVTRRAWGVLSQSIESNTHSISELNMPLVVPQGAWLAGLLFFMAVGLLLLVRSIVALLASDLPTLFRLIGSKSGLEEAEEEIRSAQAGKAAS